MYRIFQWMKKGVALVLCCSLLAGCSANGSFSNAEYAPTESILSGVGSAFTALMPGEYETVCENNAYQLQCRQDIGAFRVLEKETQAVAWNSIVTQDLYDLERSTQTWKDYMQSLVTITYVSVSDTRGNYLQAYSATEGNTIAVQVFSQGVQVSVTFAEASISLTVEIALTEEGIRARIPAQSVQEEGEYYLLSVELFPFFGASSLEEDGYIFMPDGTGTLMHFSQVGNKHIFTDSVKLDVYGNVEQSQLFEENTRQVFFPVYGIKRGEKALFANVTAGDSYTRISLNAAVAMAPVKLNRVNFEFVYRHQYRIYLSNIVSNGKDSATTLYGTKSEPDLIRLDRVVEYTFLGGDQADYSGMANTYRAYLQQNGLVNRVETDAMPLTLRFFMGDELDMGAFRKMVATTTLEDVITMIQGYQNAGVDDLQVVLQGWTKNGYSVTPQVFRPAGAIGGTAQLKQLNKFLSLNEQVQAYLELNVTDADADVGGYSLGSDVIQSAGMEPVTDKMGKSFLLSPFYSAQKMSSALKLTKKYTSFGTAVQTIGATLYQDLLKKRRTDREQTKMQWVSMLEEAAQGSVALTECSAYSLKYTDFLYDLPLSSSLHTLADEDVPWLSMVLYGLVPMSTSVGNLSSDLDKTKLQWIENGSVPSYILTKESPTLLQDADYNELYTSCNDMWQERILAVYQDMSQRLQPVQNTTVVRHERPMEGLAVLTYANGYRVAVNYADTAVEYDGQTVPSKDYAVWQGVAE